MSNPVGILITDGGAHPADKWAEATAQHIVKIAESASGERRAAAVKLEAAIIDILEGHHAIVQNGERAAIVEHGHARILHPLDADHHISVDGAVKEIVAAAKNTPWAVDFEKEETVAGLTHLLHSHFKTSMHIERSWHADRNPKPDEAKAFYALHNVGAK